MNEHSIISNLEQRNKVDGLRRITHDVQHRFGLISANQAE